MASQYLDAHAGERQLVLDVVIVAAGDVVEVVGVAALLLADGLGRPVVLWRHIPSSLSIRITVSQIYHLCTAFKLLIVTEMG